MKPCKGNYRVNKFQGCGTTQDNKRTYGLCPKCLYKWTQETEEGKEWFEKQTAFKYKKNLEEKKKEERRETRKLKDELNSKNAMRTADIYFSRFIRLKHSVIKDFEVFCTCFTCGDVRPIKEMENGHYMKREHKATRYHEDNCRPQCKTCNGDVKHNGKQVYFKKGLEIQIGHDDVIEVERLSKTMIKANGMFYRAIATKYRKLVNDMQEQLGVKVW